MLWYDQVQITSHNLDLRFFYLFFGRLWIRQMSTVS
jgi:hypothetical protein